MSMAIVVHGGAGTIAPDSVELAQAGCKEAALVGWRVLQDGGSSLDAVEAAVRALENNPNFNAGTGACLTVDGRIELDAGIMEGGEEGGLRVGAVANVEFIKNPISLARKVMDSPHVLLVGSGAQKFALEQGLSHCSLNDLMTERQYLRWKGRSEETPLEDEPRYHRREVSARPVQEEKHGTVGAVALDSLGILAAATSTGGIPNKYPGRVGDSPLVGCGFYADENAAISCTGHGEDFVRLLIAKRVADFVAFGMTARDAATAAIAVLGVRAEGTGGLIVVDRLGNVGFAWNTENLGHAFMTEHVAEPVTGV